MKSFFQVVVYLVLLLLTCPKSSFGCTFEHGSISSFFNVSLANVANVLFNDYEVEVVSNFEQDNHCSYLWWTYDIYVMLNASEKKAGEELKTRIKNLLVEFSILQNCTFTESKACTKHKQPLIQVLQELDPQKLNNFTGDYFNCTFMRCVPGNTIALTAQPVDHHDSVTTNYSTERQDTGTVPNYGVFSSHKKSEPSNNTALGQDKTPQTERNWLISIIISVIVLVSAFAFALFGRKKLLEGSHAEDYNMRNLQNRTEEELHETGSTVDHETQIDVP